MASKQTEGTSLKTATGEVAVNESLVGDLVLTYRIMKGVWRYRFGPQHQLVFLVNSREAEKVLEFINGTKERDYDWTLVAEMELPLSQVLALPMEVMGVEVIPPLNVPDHATQQGDLWEQDAIEILRTGKTDVFVPRYMVYEVYSHKHGVWKDGFVRISKREHLQIVDLFQTVIDRGNKVVYWDKDDDFQVLNVRVVSCASVGTLVSEDEIETTDEMLVLEHRDVRRAVGTRNVVSWHRDWGRFVDF